MADNNDSTEKKTKKIQIPVADTGGPGSAKQPVVTVEVDDLDDDTITNSISSIELVFDSDQGANILPVTITFASNSSENDIILGKYGASYNPTGYSLGNCSLDKYPSENPTTFTYTLTYQTASEAPDETTIAPGGTKPTATVKWNITSSTSSDKETGDPIDITT